jgi:hypothetical protein
MAAMRQLFTLDEATRAHVVAVLRRLASNPRGIRSRRFVRRGRAFRDIDVGVLEATPPATPTIAVDAEN